MCTRGVKFVHEPNELVLCFEPDPTKAKVLYYAKILEQCCGNKDRQGRRRPEYLIHFQGWNSSWDRIVPETFVLKNSDANRGLMRKLAGIARQVKRNTTRKWRIDDILERHFKRTTDTDSELTSTEEDELTDEKSVTEDDEMMTSDNEDMEELSNRTGDETSELESEATISSEDEEPEQNEQHIELELPENLRHKLEDDCYYIKAQQKLVRVPASPNIITLLEGYVKNFAVNMLCGTGEKNRNASQAIPPERNISICKELVDGLRVLFDFTLPEQLLYNEEHKQYDTVKNGSAVIKQENEPAVPERRQRRTSQRLHTPVTSPKLPTTPVKSEVSDDDVDQDQCRRMTRHAYQEEIRRSQQDPKPQNNSTSPAKPLSERVTPPPPLLLPTHICAPTPSGASTPTGDPLRKEVNSIFTWHLVPDGGDQSPASLYGAIHLLRLFVKLPSLLTDMRLPDVTLRHLLNHLEMFIDYLSGRYEELFPDSIYVDAPSN